MAENKKTESEARPTWEKNPDGFIDNLPNDPVWAKKVQKEKELREKFGLDDKPHMNDYSDYKSWLADFKADRDRFNQVTGCQERHEKAIALYWSGAFDEGKFDSYSDFLSVAEDLNHRYGEATLEEVVAEWRRRNAQ